MTAAATMLAPSVSEADEPETWCNNEPWEAGSIPDEVWHHQSFPFPGGEGSLFVGVDHGLTGAFGSVSVCIAFSESTGEFSNLNTALNLELHDTDPDREGRTLRVRTCQGRSSCTDEIQRIGIETAGAGDCGSATGTCVSRTTVYGSPTGEVTVENRTGLDPVLIVPPATETGTPTCVLLVCTVPTKLDFGRVDVYADSFDPVHSQPMCVVVGGSNPPAPGEPSCE